MGQCASHERETTPYDAAGGGACLSRPRAAAHAAQPGSAVSAADAAAAARAGADDSLPRRSRASRRSGSFDGIDTVPRRRSGSSRGELGSALISVGGGGLAAASGEVSPAILAASRRRLSRAVLEDGVFGQLSALPRRSAAQGSGTADAASRRAEPEAPTLVFHLMEEAVKAANLKWASTSPALAAILADDIEFVDLRGVLHVGKADTLAALDDGMEKLLRRISRSTRSGKNELRTDHLKLRIVEAPHASRKGVWRMLYVFKLYVMQVRIQEEYEFDEDGLVRRLVRSMATAQGSRFLSSSEGARGHL